VTSLPELVYIIAFLGCFLGTFFVSNILAKGAGYKE
jgi:hypothetical protein